MHFCGFKRCQTIFGIFVCSPLVNISHLSLSPTSVYFPMPCSTFLMSTCQASSKCLVHSLTSFTTYSPKYNQLLQVCLACIYILRKNTGMSCPLGISPPFVFSNYMWQLAVIPRFRWANNNLAPDFRQLFIVVATAHNGHWPFTSFLKWRSGNWNRCWSGIRCFSGRLDKYSLESGTILCIAHSPMIL